jgi:hypothetical protein
MMTMITMCIENSWQIEQQNTAYLLYQMHTNSNLTQMIANLQWPLTRANNPKELRVQLVASLHENSPNTWLSPTSSISREIGLRTLGFSAGWGWRFEIENLKPCKACSAIRLPKFIRLISVDEKKITCKGSNHQSFSIFSKPNKP